MTTPADGPFVYHLAMRVLILSGLVFLAASCGEKVKVNVECVTVAAPAVECVVTQTAGKSEVEVCWDFQVKCANGQVVKAPHSCHKVANGGTEKVTIPGNELEGIESCAGSSPPTATLSNITINGKPSE